MVGSYQTVRELTESSPFDNRDPGRPIHRGTAQRARAIINRASSHQTPTERNHTMTTHLTNALGNAIDDAVDSLFADGLRDRLADDVTDDVIERFEPSLREAVRDMCAEYQAAQIEDIGFIDRSCKEIGRDTDALTRSHMAHRDTIDAHKRSLKAQRETLAIQDERIAELEAHVRKLTEKLTKRTQVAVMQKNAIDIMSERIAELTDTTTQAEIRLDDRLDAAAIDLQRLAGRVEYLEELRRDDEAAGITDAHLRERDTEEADVIKFQVARSTTAFQAGGADASGWREADTIA